MLIRRQPWRGVRNSSGRANTSAWNALCKMYEMQFSKCRNTVERVAVAHQERGLCPAGCYRPREAARTIWKLRIPRCTPPASHDRHPTKVDQESSLEPSGAFLSSWRLVLALFLSLLHLLPHCQNCSDSHCWSSQAKKDCQPLFHNSLNEVPFHSNPTLLPPWALPIAIVCEIFLSPCKRPVCGPSQCVAAAWSAPQRFPRPGMADQQK